MAKLIIEITYDKEKINDSSYLELLKSHLFASVSAELYKLLYENSNNVDDREDGVFRNFEDLSNATSEQINYILRNVTSTVVALALKGASSQLKEYILKQMSERASAILLEDMSSMGPVRVRDVDNAQKEMLQVLLNYIKEETEQKNVEKPDEGLIF